MKRSCCGAALTVASVLLTALLTASAATAATPVPEVEGPLPVDRGVAPVRRRGVAAPAAGPRRPRVRRGGVPDQRRPRTCTSGRRQQGRRPHAGRAVRTRVLVRRPARPPEDERDRRRRAAQPVEPLRPEHRLGDVGRPVHAQRRRLGRLHLQAGRRQGAQDVRRRPVRLAGLGQSAPAQRPAELHGHPDDRRPAGRALAHDEDGLVWDIISQVGTWLQSDAASNPLVAGKGKHRGSRVERAYGFGYSQTGSMLITYINAIQPRVVAAEGKPIFDGYFVGVAGGRFIGAAPLNQCTPVPPLGDPRRSIRNAGVPVIQMMSQSDYLTGIASRGPDGSTPPDLYRHYEMAGAGHATPDELFYSARSGGHPAAGRAVPPMDCNEGPRSRFPSRIFVDAALRNIDLWSRHGMPAPPGRDILVENGQPVLDEFGNVVGGLRSPYLDVPTSTWFGEQHRRVVLRHRRARGSVRPGDAGRGSTRAAARTSAPWRGTSYALVARALHHAARRPGPAARGRARRTSARSATTERARAPRDPRGARRPRFPSGAPRSSSPRRRRRRRGRR